MSFRELVRHGSTMEVDRIPLYYGKIDQEFEQNSEW